MEEKDTKKNAPQGKGKGKNKKQTMNLEEFVNAGQPPAGFATSNLRWSAVMEDEDDDSKEFGSNLQDNVIVLPTAPKAQRGPDIDIDQVPTQPPFLCYMSNLPFEAVEDDIYKFFKDLKITRVDLGSRDSTSGRMRGGQGTCEFPDRQTLIDAFTFNNETIKNRPVKMSIHSFDHERDRYHRGRDGRDGDQEDRTAGDWRSGPASRPMGGNFPPSNRSYQSDSNNFGNNRNYNNRNYGDRGYGDRDRGYGDRDRGYGDRNMNDSFGDNRNSYNNRSMNRGMDRGNYNHSNNYPNHQDRGDYGRSDYMGRPGEPDEPRSDEAPRERPRLNLMPPSKPRAEQQPPVEKQAPLSGSQEQVNRRSESESSETTRRSIEPERPVERKRLVLLPPSKKENTEPTEPAAPKSSSSIFGEAKPVDTTKRLLEVETKIKEKLDDVKIEQELEKFEKPPRDLNSLRGSREFPKRLSSDSGSHTSERQGDAGGDGPAEGGQRSGYYRDHDGQRGSSNRFNSDDGNYRRSGGNRRMNNQGGRNYDGNYNRDNRDGYGRSDSNRDYNRTNKYNNNNRNNWSNDQMIEKRPQQHDYEDQHSNRMGGGSGGNRQSRDRNEGYQTVNKFNLLKEGEMD